MKGLILGGGKGTRLRPLTLNTPKPIVPVANRPFLLYQIDLMKTAGLGEIILSLSYLPRKIEDLLKDGADFDVRVHYAVEGEPLGTAGAFKNAEEWIDEPAVVFNGDVLTSLDLPAVIAAHQHTGAVATIVLTPVDDPSAYGLVEFDDAGRVTRFLEKPDMDTVTTNNINAGTYVLDPRVFEYIPGDRPFSFERELFPALLEAGLPVYAYTSDCYWIDIGTPEHYLEAHMDILAGRFRSPSIPPTALETGAENGASIDERSLIAPDVSIGRGARIASSVIGPNCRIREGARVVDSVVWPGVTIEENASVTGAIVGRSCSVGRSAVLKSGTVLGGMSSITDFSSV